MKLHPDFIILGGPRSGTTYLYDILKQHPEIYLRANKRPEPHFFALNSRFNKGIDWYYSEVFSDYKGEKISGEASTTMLYCYNAIKRIKEHNPSCKFIVLLREPVSRAISEYVRSIETNHEHLNFEDAILNEKMIISNAQTEYDKTFEPSAYGKRGFYSLFIKKWFEEFQPSQFYFGLTLDLIKETQTEVDKIMSFLKIESKYSPDFSIAEKNDSKTLININTNFIKHLKNTYKESNKELSQITGLDLTEWTL